MRLSYKEAFLRKAAFDRWEAASIMCVAASCISFSRSADVSVLFDASIQYTGTIEIRKSLKRRHIKRAF